MGGDLFKYVKLLHLQNNLGVKYNYYKLFRKN